jgi:flagellar basal body P-ring formation protein FlgA
MIGAAFASFTMLAIPPGACLPVAGGEILARDLAPANALFSTIDPDAIFGFAPMPGARRTVLGRELNAFAQRNGIAVVNAPIANLCVERQAAPLRPADISAALAEAIGIPDARIELLDYSRQPVPSGRLDFRRNSVGAPDAGISNNPVIWRGRLNYDAQHSLAIWAKVRISVERPVVIAAADLVPGHPIEPQQIRMVRMPVFPSSAGLLEALEPVLGKTVSRPVRAGQPVLPSSLREPNDVSAGEKVQVRVVDGSANVSFEATALASGRKSETISLRNPASGRIFRGIVEGRGLVVVRPGGPA